MKKWILLTCLISIQSSAASLGTYRIYLDSENSQQKFMVKNDSATPEKCDVSFSYMAYDGKGGVKKLSNTEQAALSEPAIKHLRYSPRQFTIKPKSSQYIAFSYRRQINDKSAEYRTYANIQCIEVDTRLQKGITLKPTIMHSVPLVIRTGKTSDFDVSIAFTRIKQIKNNINFRLTHQGNRSVYGDLNLVDAAGDKVKVLQRNVVIYPEMKYKDFDFSLAGFNNKNMNIVFKETGKYNAKKLFTLPLAGAL
jgi:hypothetical protein